MFRRPLVPTILFVLAAAVVQAAGAPAAHAHAQVASTEPRAGASLAEPPRRVFIEVKKKQATRAGDPIHVFGPDGTRVDTGDVVISNGGTVISVGLRPDLEPGTYRVLYQITSADTHIIEKDFTFAVTAGAAQGAAVAGVAAASPPGRAAVGPSRLRVIGPPAASIVAAAVLLLSFVVLLVMLRRRRRKIDEAQQSSFRVVPSEEHRFGPPRAAGMAGMAGAPGGPGPAMSGVRGGPRTRTAS